MTQLRDVMTANPTIFPATATIADAARAMRDTDVGDVLVERGTVRGCLVLRPTQVPAGGATSPGYLCCGQFTIFTKG